MAKSSELKSDSVKNLYKRRNYLRQLILRRKVFYNGLPVMYLVKADADAEAGIPKNHYWLARDKGDLDIKQSALVHAEEMLTYQELES